MLNNKTGKDERFVAVEKSSFYLAYWIVNFAILVDIFYRNLVLNQDTWDLMGIIVIANLAAILYQIRFRIISRTNIMVTLFVTLAAIIWAVLTIIFKLGG
jgi:hypothetical protein